MKKLFSFLIICFVLCFGSVVFAFDTVPTFVTTVANSSTSNYDPVLFKSAALDYINNNLTNELDSYTYVYLFPYLTGSTGSVNFSGARYFLLLCNEEVGWYSGTTSQSPIPIIPCFNSAASFRIYKFTFDFTNASNFTVNYANSTAIYNSDGYYMLANGSNPITWDDSTTTSSIWCSLAKKWQSNMKFVGASISPSAFYNTFVSKTGEIKYWTDDTYTTKNFLSNTDTFTTITSADYFNISVSRDSLEQVSNGSSNFYAYTNIDFSFNQYFSDNISTNAELYYTLIIDSLDYSFIPITQATNGYTNNRVRLDLSTANSNMLSNIYNGLTFVCWYQLPNSSVRLGQTSYKFYVNANYTPTATSPSGGDNTVTVTGHDNSIPINISNVIQYDDDLNNSGISNTDSSNIDFSDGDMRSRFSAMFDFFSVAFAWLPAEIIVMVKAGFAIAVVFLIYKIIRG